jgi:GT2 family glycosyltransferase
MMAVDAVEVSVVLPTYGRRTLLVRVLEGFARQHVHAGVFEVVVVCDGDRDGSAAACAALASRLSYPLRVISQEHRGPAAARDRGVQEARADLILFFDDDQLPDPGLIQAHLDAHHRSSAIATLGMVTAPPGERLQLWCAWEQETIRQGYEALARHLYAPTWRQFFTNNVAIRREHLLAVGGFDPAFSRLEDVELGWRLDRHGIRFVFLPQARGVHYSQRSFTAWLRIPGAYGAADIALWRKHHTETPAILAGEFPTRHRLVQRLVRATVGRRVARSVTRTICGAVIRACAVLHLDGVGFRACSVLYNLEYYQGVAGALGGRAPFLALLNAP